MSVQRIAIIEDDPWLLGSYKRVFARAGYDVVSAASPQEAIDLIDDVSPAAIVLDLMLRGGDAVLLLHEIASHSDLAKTPIIMLTTHAPELDAESLKAYNVGQLLDKTTIEPDELVAAVKRALL